MDNLDAEALGLNHQAQRFAAFTGVLKPEPSDRFILVMGMTGSGKSSFISRCTEQPVGIGHNLDSCTKDVDVFSFQSNGTRTYLIDTPGFNDTNQPDIETLSTLATYLGASYANGVRVHGIVMLHPISDNRMRGTSLRNIQMIQAICGFVHYDNFAIATTMWPGDAKPEDARMLEEREAELKADDRFFGALVAAGASYFRHNSSGSRIPQDETRSARHIVGHLTRKAEWRVPPILKLQRQLVDRGMTLEETDAGRIVAGDLHKARREFEHQLQELRAGLQARLTAVDAEHAVQLQELQKDVETRMKKVEEEKKALKRSVTDLHQREEQLWKKRFADMEQRFFQRVEAKEQELKDMEESLAAMRKELARQSNKSTTKPQRRRETEIEEYEKIVDDARKEARYARNAHNDLRNQKKANVVNGAVNGIAAGTLSGVIAAVAAGGLLCNVM